MEPWALRTRKVRELEQELSVVLDDADGRAAGFTRRSRAFEPMLTLVVADSRAIRGLEQPPARALALRDERK